MKLIARKPCSFGGQKFFIGDEVAADLVVDPIVQERLGVITIVNVDEAPAEQSGVFYTQDQVDEMLAEAIEEAVNNTIAEMEQKQEELQQTVAELTQMEPQIYDGVIMISVKGSSDGENMQITDIPATPEEIQKVFEVMQMNVEEGTKAIADIRSENVLILLHASDSRKTVRDAVKKQADSLFANEVHDTSASNGAVMDNNVVAGTNTEGADA